MQRTTSTMIQIAREKHRTEGEGKEEGGGEEECEIQRSRWQCTVSNNTSAKYYFAVYCFANLSALFGKIRMIRLLLFAIGNCIMALLGLQSFYIIGMVIIRSYRLRII
mmetsp:Transcript_33567/g.69338  ORF Transcript_33567/g.69338 Transcript_33567/m.69338 type:complete len:108 (+) Transcript_33567:311-634(+)